MRKTRRRATKCRHGRQGRAGAILSILGMTLHGLRKAMRTRTRRRASGLGRRGLPHWAQDTACPRGILRLRWGRAPHGSQLATFAGSHLATEALLVRQP